MNISDEQVDDAVEAFRRKIAVEGMVFDARHAVAMRAALEAYERTRAPDPRVVELVEAATDAHDFAVNTSRNDGKELDRRFYRLRAALAAMENDK